MSARWLWGLAVAWSGCTCGIALCRTDADCSGSGRCEPSLGVCLVEPAGQGGGASAGELSIRVPAVAAQPDVQGTVYSDVPAAHRRDEQLFVWLEASVPITSPSLTVGGLAAPLADPSSCVEPCTGQCTCFRVDLWGPPLPALRGELALSGAALDAGGRALAATGAVRVTRVGWRRALGQPILATPAVGVDGTLFVGTAASASSGSLMAISASGQLQWARPLGRIVGSVLLLAPVAQSQTVFVGALTDHAEVTALDRHGSVLAQCALSKSATLEASPAEVAEGAAFYANRTHELLAMRPGRTPACEVLARAGDDVGALDGLVSSGASVLFVDARPDVYRYELSPSGWLANQQGQWPGTLPMGYRNRGLAVSGGKVVGAGVLASGGTVFQASVAGNFKFDFGFAPPRLTAPAAGPAVTADGLCLVGVPSGVAAVSVQDVRLGSGAAITTTVALGEGSRAYALGDDGSLSEWAWSGGTPVRGWSALLDDAASTGFSASPTLDCARDAAGLARPGRPGVLYAASRSGTVFAVIVDARGLDTTAPWPKSQRDPRNSGRADTDLRAFACP